MKPKFWTVVILASVAVIAGEVWYVRQPAQDLGPIVIHHAAQTQVPAATSTPAASSTAPDLSGASSPGAVEGWKTYTNSQYGFSFEYPANTVINGSSDSSINIATESFADFSATLNNGAFEERLSYDYLNRKWQVKLGTNQTAADGFCPIKELSAQQLPYYQIGDFRSGRIWEFAYVTAKNVIVISEWDTDVSTKLNPSKIKFDNPQEIVKAGCEISN